MISIVMAYYNRRDLLLNTLASIRKSSCSDYEIVVADDASDDHHRLEDVEGIRLIRISKEEKTWYNSCIAFNRAINAAIGDKIILQNPECMHAGDILTYVENHSTPDNYLTFGCYSLADNNNFKVNPYAAWKNGGDGWYNHSIFRPVKYHFCSAISSHNLKEKLGGFDERYQNGVDYDDNELLTRIQRLGLPISIIDDPFVYHQNHYSEGYRPGMNKSNSELYGITQSESIIKVNV